MEKISLFSFSSDISAPVKVIVISETTDKLRGAGERGLNKQPTVQIVI